MALYKKVEDREAAKRLVARLYESDKSAGMLKGPRVGMCGNSVHAEARKTKSGYTVEITTTVWSEYTLQKIFNEAGV